MKGSILLAIIVKFYNFCSGMHENPAVYSLANKFCVSMRGRVYRHFLVSRSSFYPVRCRHDRQDILKMQASQTKVDMKDR
jgi:hypothetical protein